MTMETQVLNIIIIEKMSFSSREDNLRKYKGKGNVRFSSPVILQQTVYWGRIKDELEDIWLATPFSGTVAIM